MSDRVTFESHPRARWAWDEKQVREMVEELDVDGPVKFIQHEGDEDLGITTCDFDHSAGTIRANEVSICAGMGPKNANRVIWHELKHLQDNSEQVRQLGIEDAKRLHLIVAAFWDYADSPIERRAMKHEKRRHERKLAVPVFGRSGLLPLVMPCCCEFCANNEARKDDPIEAEEPWA